MVPVSRLLLALILLCGALSAQDVTFDPEDGNWPLGTEVQTDNSGPAHLAQFFDSEGDPIGDAFTISSGQDSFDLPTDTSLIGHDVTVRILTGEGEATYHLTSSS